MREEEQKFNQPIRELQWLAQYFKSHGREDLSHKIFKDLKALRQEAQDSLSADQPDGACD